MVWRRNSVTVYVVALSRPVLISSISSTLCGSAQIPAQQPHTEVWAFEMG